MEEIRAFSKSHRHKINFKPRQCCAIFILSMLVIILYYLNRLGNGSYSREIQNDNSGPHIVFSHYGEVRLVEKLAFSFARLNSPPETRITVLAHEVKSDYSWTQISSQNGISIKYFSLYNETRNHIMFRRLYVHASVHEYKPPVSFDYFAQARFLSLSAFMQMYDIKSCIFLDTDIILLGNIFTHLIQSTTLTLYSDYATHWTQEEALLYSDYLIDFLNRSHEEIARNMTSVGQRSGFEVILDSHPQIDVWWPVSIPRYHFSDMHFFKFYLKYHRTSLQVLCEESVCGGDTSMSGLINAHILTKCDSAESFIQPFSLQNNKVALNSGKYVLGLHFQGECKGLMKEIFCGNISIWGKGCSGVEVS